jgi:hypothetical protein
MAAITERLLVTASFIKILYQLSPCGLLLSVNVCLVLVLFLFFFVFFFVFFYIYVCALEATVLLAHVISDSATYF